MEDNIINTLFKSLETFIQKNELEKAKNLLIENKTKFDHEVYLYNLGVVHAKMEDLPLARFYMEQSLKEGFSSLESVKNLKHIKEKLEVVALEEPKSFFDYTSYFSHQAPSSLYVSISLGLLLIILFYRKKFQTKLSLAFAILFALNPLGYKLLILDSYKESVILQARYVYSVPSKMLGPSHEIPSGIKLILGKKYKNWVRIEYPNELKGWISSDDLLTLKENNEFL